MFCVRGGDLNPNKFPWEVSQFVRIAPQILTNPAQTSGELSGLETKSPPLSKKPPKVTLPLATVYHTVLPTRSEERRVGKECRSRMSPNHKKKKRKKKGRTEEIKKKKSRHTTQE